MVTIDQVTVSSYDLTSLTVSWTFEETWEDLTSYTINVYRSHNEPVYSVSGGFTLIYSGISAVDTAEYEDTTVSGYRSYKWSDFYYAVVPYYSPTTTSGAMSTPARLTTIPDPRAKEIIRREALAFKTRYGGKMFLVLKRKKTGTRCSACYDSIMMRRTKENCVTCYDTSWVGGYWDPIQVSGSMSAMPRQTAINTFGEWEPQDGFIRLGPTPVLSPQDVIIDIQNRRWRVSDIRPLEKGQYIIQQQARLTRIVNTDVINEYPITWP